MAQEQLSKLAPEPVFIDVSLLTGYDLGLYINSIEDERPLHWKSFSGKQLATEGSFLESPRVPLDWYLDEASKQLLPQRLLELIEDLGEIQHGAIQAVLTSESAYQLAESCPILFILLVHFARIQKITEQEFKVLVTLQRKEILNFCGLPATKSYLKFLQRFRIGLIKRAHFERLMNLISTEYIVAQLRHVQQPTFNHLVFIDEFMGEPWPNILNAIDAGIPLPRLRHLLTFAQDTLRMGNPIVVRAINNFDDLYILHNQIVRRDHQILITGQNTEEKIARYEELHGDYPPAPIPGNGTVEPLNSWADLIHEGLDMRHCVGTYGSQVASGQVFIYKGIGKQRLTISIVMQRGRWRLSQIYGPCNAQPSEEAKEEVILWFKENYFDKF